MHVRHSCDEIRVVPELRCESVNWVSIAGLGYLSRWGQKVWLFNVSEMANELLLFGHLHGQGDSRQLINTKKLFATGEPLLTSTHLKQSAGSALPGVVRR